ncbi:DUF6086 family protein [Streptomyces sp. NPDC057939]|uniref:DUF6086 family protein n=1 Tax=Streptomyces sp. NPDC057939 TaxID=3346284 RepID=UPI0036F1353F
MSQLFLLGDDCLWNPSNGAARLFQRHVALFEAELDLPSGIGELANDESEITPELLEVFVNALLARHRRTGHAIALALSEGFTATVLVLAERAGIRVNWALLAAGCEPPFQDVQVSAGTGLSVPVYGVAWADGLRARARELGGRMPR